MSELQTTDWDETAANNNQTAPNGFPEGMAPSGVNDAAREVMAQVKRWFNRVTGRADAGTLISSGGTSTAITVTYDTAPASLYTGLECSFKVTTTCGADPTLNVNSLGAKNIQKMIRSGYVNLIAGDLVATQHAKVKYDGTLDKWVLLTPSTGDVSVSAHKNGTDQTGVTSAVATKVTFGTEVWDIGAAFASSTWTPPAGRYQITSVVRFTNANAVDNETLEITLYKNGSAHKLFTGKRGGAATQSVGGSWLVEANGTDTFEIYALKGGAGDGTIGGNAAETYFFGTTIA